MNAITTIKDAKREYEVAVDRGTGIKVAKERYMRALFNNAEALLNLVGMIEMLQEENADLHKQLEAKTPKKPEKADKPKE